MNYAIFEHDTLGKDLLYLEAQHVTMAATHNSAHTQMQKDCYLMFVQ